MIIKADRLASPRQGADTVTQPDGRDAIIAAVAATNTEGVTGEIAFDANGDTTNKAITLYTVTGGKWVTQGYGDVASARRNSAHRRPRV